MEENVKKSDEEVIDVTKYFKNIKNIFIGKNKGFKPFLKDHGFWFIPLLCILIAMSFSVFMRIQPAYLPITDDWADNSIENYVKSQVETKINQQYPNLPSENKQSLITAEMQNVMKQQEDQLVQQKEALSQQYKAKMQDEDGRTYLLAIDPYYWYGLAKNKIEYGHYGNKINEEGKSVYTLRNGRIGKKVTSFLVNPAAMVIIYRIMHLFNPSLDLMGAAFYMPLILVTLTIIPIFFVTRKVGGNVGGLFASIIFAVNSALLSRTPAGFADSDAYNVLFPAFIAWMLIEALDAKSARAQKGYIALGGLFTGLFAMAWSGWGFMYDFVIATIGLMFLSYIVVYKKTLFGPEKLSDGIKDFFKRSKVKSIITILVTYLISAALFVTLFVDFNSYTSALLKPLKFMKIKDVAVKTVWPNVMTTVAEFNTVDFSKIVTQMGGKLLFYIAIAGIVLTVFRKDERDKIDLKHFFLLSMWFVGTAYAFTKGTRFALLMVPAFAIAFGVAIGYVFKVVSEWSSRELKINMELSKIMLFIVLALLLVSPVKSGNNVAKHEIPSFNDAWHDTLRGIHDASDDSIITSWWDFGHWFVTMGERRVTFDGGDQGKRIHWVGRSLVTDDEEESAAILKMLNCGQEESHRKLKEYLEDDYKAVMLLKNIIMMDRSEAEQILKENGLSDAQVTEVLDLSHCDNLIDNFYIASEDMVGKAGVWGHFGSWDFEKASMYNKVKKIKSYEEGISILKEEFNLSPEKADNYYYEIKNKDADKWISPWPGYYSSLSNCKKEDNVIFCNNGVEVNLNTMEPYINSQGGRVQPKKMAYLDSNHEFKVKEFESDIPYGIALVLNGDSYRSILMSQEQTASMFTRLFYFEGHGLKYFKPFSDKTTFNGQRILTYRMNWDANETNEVEKFLPSLEVKASHILITMQENATEEERKQKLLKIEQLQAKALSGDNFAVLAKENSDCPSGKEGGDLGWFGKGNMVKPFEDAAFSLDVGEMSDVVETRFGYHLIYLTGKRRGESVEEINLEIPVEEKPVNKTTDKFRNEYN